MGVHRRHAIDYLCTHEHRIDAHQASRRGCAPPAPAPGGTILLNRHRRDIGKSQPQHSAPQRQRLRACSGARLRRTLCAMSSDSSP
eukprot:COSAG01_NODE_2379_length_7794_cov_7.414295_7_plen_86_part_00